MPIKDPFSYSARWDSVGLDCSHCIHFVGPVTWPDLESKSHCGLHKVSLAVELGKNGFKDGEWFCKDFTDNGKANKEALEQLEKTRDSLLPKVLSGAYGGDGFLKEVPFEKL
jgi:hypothetical protein